MCVTHELLSCAAVRAQLQERLPCPTLCAKAHLLTIRTMVKTRCPETFDLTSEQDNGDWSRVKAAMGEVGGKTKPVRFRPTPCKASVSAAISASQVQVPRQGQSQEVAGEGRQFEALEAKLGHD